MSVFDHDDFVARARLRLDAAPGPTHGSADELSGDIQEDPSLAEFLIGKTIRAAAVLVPVVDRPQPTVLLTQRSAHLPDHSGQVAFPGGKIDEEDEGPLATALREAEEEIGLTREFIAPVGFLSPYQSATGFRIHPVVALVRPGFALELNTGEVDEAFEVPLSFLMSAGNHQRHSREVRGRTRHFYAMPYGERFIWGVTAGILRRLYERLYL